MSAPSSLPLASLAGRPSRASLALAGLCSLGLLACAPPAPLPSGPAAVECEDVATPLGSLQETTPLGVSAQSILDYAAPAQTSPLHWRNTARAGQFRFASAPESGTTSITSELVPGQARWVVSTPKTALGDPDDQFNCPDRLEIDVQLKLSTAQGALNELVNTTLVATSPHAASIRYAFDLEKNPLQGSLAMTNVDPQGVTIDTLLVDLSYTPAQNYGSLRFVAKFEDQFARAYFADWPQKPPTFDHGLIHDCLGPHEQFWLPISEEINGLSAAKIAAALGAQNPLKSTAVGLGREQRGEVSFAPTQDRACAAGVHEALTFENRLQYAVSGLLRLNLGTFVLRTPVTALAASHDEQGVTQIALTNGWSGRNPLRGALDEEAFVATYGRLGLKLSGYPYYALYVKMNYDTHLAAKNAGKALVGGVQVMGIQPDRQSPGGAIYETIGQWNLQGR